MQSSDSVRKQRILRMVDVHTEVPTMLFLCLPAIWVHLSCIAWGSYHNAL